MGPEKRKERLAELVATPIKPEDVKPRDIILSIKELNLMEHVYDPSPPVQDNRQILIVVGDEAGKLALQKLLSGGERRHDGNSPQLVTPPHPTDDSP